MRRLFRDLRLSRFPTVLGLCVGDIPSIAAFANEAQQRLINDSGETGWWGGWDKLAFTASWVNPYVTTPYNYARMIGFDVCRTPIRIQNPFFEVLDAGIGLRGPNNCIDSGGPKESYDRGTFPSMKDLEGNNQFLRVYITNNADVGKTVLFSNCLDNNGVGIYTQNGSSTVNGFALTLASPSVTSTFPVSSFTGFAKDITQGDLVLVQVDGTTGTEVQLSRYKPQETNPAYRRYYFSNLPQNCCNQVTPAAVAGDVTITALGKLEFIPIQSDTDYLIIGNIPALIEEAQAIAFSSMESPNAMALEAKHHAKAIRLLQAEQRHYLGENLPATNFAPFGTATLQRASIGTMI